MNNKSEKNNMIDEILKDAHKEIVPPDSWQALRARIDKKLQEKELLSSSDTGRDTKETIFWRRLAFGMAACFLMTAGILIYFLLANYGMQEYQQKQLAAANNLLNQAELNRLNFAFSQVRQLFGQQSGWLMIGSENNTQVGVTDKIAPGVSTDKIVVVRLAVNRDGGQAARQYFDVVTFSNQQANFQLALDSTSVIDIFLKPMLKNDGRIEVEINAQINGGPQAKGISTVANNTFTSLVRMRANGNLVNIDGIGQSMSNI